MFSSYIADKEMGFRAFVLQLAERVGLHHIPLRDEALDIHELVAADAVHHELVKCLIRTVYRANQCGHLDAMVSAIPTFAALGAIRGQLASSPDTDIDQINLLDEIGWAARQILAAEPAGRRALRRGIADTGRVYPIRGSRLLSVRQR